MSSRVELALVFLGGAAGALARVGLTQLFPAGDGAWPWAVLLINLVGAWLLGLLTGGLERRRDRAGLRPLLGAGFCGAFTTFSTLQLELLDMVRGGRIALALLYAAVSLLAGVAAVRLGRSAGSARGGDMMAVGP